MPGSCGMARSALRQKWTLGACALELLGGAGAGAQSYPSKPIQFIVNNSPGAGTDLAARLVADRLNV